MFDEAIKQYAKIIHGNKTYLSIIFHALTGAVIGTFLFIVINASSNGELTILNVNIGVNTTRLFLLDPRLLNFSSPVSKEAKILEFLILFIVSTAVTSGIEYARRRRALRDALSPIREEILGKWHLELADFAMSGQKYRNFSCKIWFDSTEAQKLRVFYFESNELEVDGNSPLVALYVAEGTAGPEQIDLTFPLAAEIHLPGRSAFSILYWIRLNHFALRDNRQGIAFKGQWYSIANAGSEYQSAGPATLRFESRARYNNPA